MDEEKTLVTVSIPQPLFRKIEERIRGTHFDSVSSYVTHVVQEVLAETEESERKVLSRDDEQKVVERLRALGYLG
jgi:Arc/MetJ-type ribon-helix-helix transcriptional regulator